MNLNSSSIRTRKLLQPSHASAYMTALPKGRRPIRYARQSPLDVLLCVMKRRLNGIFYGTMHLAVLLRSKLLFFDENESLPDMSAVIKILFKSDGH